MAINPIDKNAGDPNGGYPSAADMPEMKMGQKPEDMTSNPVVDAFETIAKFVVSLEQKKSPNAAQAKEMLKNLMQSVVGGEPTPEPDVEGEPIKPMDEQNEDPSEDIPEDKSGKQFDPFKDPSMDGKETVKGSYPDSEQIKKEMMKKKSKPTNIQPLA